MKLLKKASQLAILLVAVAALAIGQTEPQEFNGHLFQQWAVSFPAMSAGDEFMGLYTNASGVFLRLYHAAPTPRTTVYVLRSGRFVPLVEDTNPTLVASNAKLGMKLSSSFPAAGGTLTFGKDAMYLTSLVRINGYNYIGASWRQKYSGGQPEKVLGLNEPFTFEEYRKEVSVLPVSVYPVFASTDGKELTPVRYSRGAALGEALFQAGTPFQEVVEASPLRSIFGTLGVWSTFDRITYTEIAGRDMWVMQYDKKSGSKKEVLSLGQSFPDGLVMSIKMFGDSDYNVYPLWYAQAGTNTYNSRVSRINDDGSLSSIVKSESIAGTFIDSFIPYRGSGLLGLMRNSGRDRVDAVGHFNGSDATFALREGDTILGEPMQFAPRNNATTETVAYHGCVGYLLSFKDGLIARGINLIDPCLQSVVQMKDGVSLNGANFSKAPQLQVLVDGVSVPFTLVNDGTITITTADFAGRQKVWLHAGASVVSGKLDLPQISVRPTPAIASSNGVMPATLKPGPVTPGGLATVHGTNFSEAQFDNPGFPGLPTTAIKEVGKPYPTVLGGCKVLWDGREVPLSFAATLVGGQSQANFIVPAAATPGIHEVTVVMVDFSTGKTELARSQPYQVTVASVNPSLFGNDAYPVFVRIRNRDNNLVSTEFPAQTGDYGELIGVGLGSPSVPIADGQGPEDVVEPGALPIVPLREHVEMLLEYRDANGNLQYWAVEAQVYARPFEPGKQQINVLFVDRYDPSYQPQIVADSGKDYASVTPLVRIDGSELMRLTPIYFAPTVPQAPTEQ